ncbi:Moulting cycle MLT-10-like protein family-containing protein [Strongyloides ratti]|uniref:Moulting cycle MLT-10-like protein family-containing protein n=1 Tax=Strongyloides ratti TaxID=34506 RepID=A0A090KZ46_STRRB|nr:Moulting cycle MLT-10-like protein family-containing protein [Strongyloides ratti]CEF61147.1 Moulting cycle MLT-10-like protein family-containing protein [Strongyloides ratti]
MKINNKLESTKFIFDLTKINNLYHLISIKFFLKSKAKNILKTLPIEESVIFNICMKDAKILQDLAKCVGNVIKVKNYYKKNKIKKDNLFKISIIKRTDKVEKKRKRINRPKSCIICRRILEKNLTKSKKIYFRKKRDYKFVDKNKKQIDSLYNNDLPFYLKKLHYLQEYGIMKEYVHKYILKKSKENEEILNKLNYSIKYKFFQEEKEISNNNNNMFSKIIDILNNYISQKQKYLIFSPRLFNLFPTSEESNNKNNEYLSPTLFSFHNKDGFLSIPEILKSTSLSNNEINHWINILIDVSGAGIIVNKTIESLDKKMIEMKNIIYPNIIAVENREKVFMKFKEIISNEQKNDYTNNGYSFLNKKQIDFLFEKNFFKYNNKRLTEISYLSKDQLEDILEKSIINLGENNDIKNKWRDVNLNLFTINNKNNRNKREKKEDLSDINDEKKDDKDKNEHFSILKPSVFSTSINEPVFIDFAILSPEAFMAEIASPEAFSLQILDPKAFVASVLSPNALFARILKPGFFRTEILSPSAINSWVLSPDIFMAEILSPKIMEAKILSPQYMFLEVLSPGLLSPNILSSDENGIVVLSPRILSPLINSNEKMVVEILSPHIFSGHINNFNNTLELGNLTNIKNSKITK